MIISIQIALLLYAASAVAQTITFSAVGDVFFGRAGKEYGTEDPFRYIKQEFQNRDVVLGNLETPISATRRRILTKPCNLKKGTCETETQEQYRRLYYLTFQGRVSAARLLREGGFTVLSTANNHAEDQGGEGMIETLGHLQQQSLGAVGSGSNRDEAWKPFIYKKNGVSIGIIAATTILNFTPTEKIGFLAHGTVQSLMEELPARITTLKKEVDFVVVTLHYGAESVRYPSPKERKLMAAMADAGADLFIGTHPHVLRGIEIINNMVVFWSLGNFLFDAPRADWCESGIVHVDFVKDASGTSMKNIRLVPVTLSGDPKRLPHPASPPKAQKIISDIQKNSRRFRNARGEVEYSDKIIRVRRP